MEEYLSHSRYRRIGHFIRWSIELLLIWIFVFPETGGWTCAVLTLITMGIEWDHVNPRDWSKY